MLVTFAQDSCDREPLHRDQGVDFVRKMVQHVMLGSFFSVICFSYVAVEWLTNNTSYTQYMKHASSTGWWGESKNTVAQNIAEESP